MSTSNRRFRRASGAVVEPVPVDYYNAPSGKRSGWIADPKEEGWPQSSATMRRSRWCDLERLETSQVLHLVLTGAQYAVRRVDEEQIKLWCNRGGPNRRDVAYLGQLMNFGIVDTKPLDEGNRTVDFYPGIVAEFSMTLRAHIVMPYFGFDSEGRLDVPPKDEWVGSVRAIEIG